MNVVLAMISPKQRITALHIATGAVVAGLAVAYLSMLALSGVQPAEILQNWYFFFVGVFGATIANSTGVGGGVVFLPAFAVFEKLNAVSLTPGQIVATSFLIQSFGMTVGSLTWANKIFSGAHSHTGVDPQTFWRMALCVEVPCLAGLFLTQYALAIDQNVIFFLFKVFSLIFGAVLLVTNLLTPREPPSRRTPAQIDYVALALIGAVGGVVTALFSIGVGEMIALYLFLRRFSMNTCVPIAVMCSAMTVIAGAPYSILANDIPWALVVCTAPGVMIGGYIARRFAYLLGPHWLKVFAATWILISSAAMIILRV